MIHYLSTWKLFNCALFYFFLLQQTTLIYVSRIKIIGRYVGFLFKRNEGMTCDFLFNLLGGKVQVMIVLSNILCHISFSILVSWYSSSIIKLRSLYETRKCFVCWWINSKNSFIHTILMISFSFSFFSFSDRCKDRRFLNNF